MNQILLEKHLSTFYTDDKQFKFELKVYKDTYTETIKFVLQLYYQTLDLYRYVFLAEWEDTLSYSSSNNRVIPFDQSVNRVNEELKKRDCIRIEGILKFATIIDIEDNRVIGLVWGDFEYGECTRNKQPPFQEKEKFIGTMFLVPISQRPAPIPPPSPIPDLPYEDQPIITPAVYQDLFPYMYMDVWPLPSKKEIILNFIPYKTPKTYARTDVFYSKLVALHKQGDRRKMQQEAVKFIDEQRPYTGMFVRDVRQLKGAVQYFNEALMIIKEEARYNDIILIVCVLSGLTPQKLSLYLASDEFKKVEQRLWQSYFALVIRQGFEFRLLENITRTLVMCHTLKYMNHPLPTAISRIATLLPILKSDVPTTSANNEDTVSDNEETTNETISDDTIEKNEISEQAKKTAALEKLFPPISTEDKKALTHATILLPTTLFPLPPYHGSPPTITDKSWVEPYAIGNLQLVQQQLRGYRYGEIAKIRNIMAGEIKEIMERNFVQTNEGNQETITNNEISKTQTLEGDDNLTKAVQETLSNLTDKYDYTDLKTQYGPCTNLTLNGSWTKNRTFSNPTTTNASTFAKKILNETTQTIEDVVSRSRSNSRISETEHQIKSIYDNSKSNEAVRGVYRWLNKVYTAQVVNYGNRMILSFMLDDPAKNYKERIFQQSGYVLEQPQTLEENGINSFMDITTTNYVSLCTTYNVKDITLPPMEQKITTTTLEGEESKFISIPDGYQAKNAYVTVVQPKSSNITDIQGLIGRYKFGIGTPNPIALSGEDTTVPTSIAYIRTSTSPPQIPSGLSVTIEVECTAKDNLMNEWRIKIYNALRDGYEAQNKAYHAQFQLNTTLENNQSNPDKNRIIIREELKRLCIRELLEVAVTINHLPNSSSPPTYEVNLPRYIQFLEASFEWNELTYVLVEDYSNNFSDQIYYNIFSDEDQLFATFLQAKKVRVLLPVTPKYNHHILYYIQSGLVWTGIDELIPAFEAQTSALNELKKIENNPSIVPNENIIDSWEVVVPTTMQILQTDREAVEMINVIQ